MQTNLDYSQIASIVVLTENGLERPEIARLCECTSKTIWEWQKRLALL